jgi:hypothetical protein
LSENLSLYFTEKVCEKEDGTRGLILGRKWDRSLKSFTLCYSQSPLLTDITTPSFLSKSGLKLVCNVNIVYGNLKSENYVHYAQEPQRNCTLMNSSSRSILKFTDFGIYSIREKCLALDRAHPIAVVHPKVERAAQLIQLSKIN